jgi:hypothetical protein
MRAHDGIAASRSAAAAGLALAAFGAVLLLAAAGCSTPPAAAPSGRYADARGHFSIAPPPGWQTKQNPGGSGVAFLEPLQGPADDFRENINIVVAPWPKDMGLAEYAKANDDDTTQRATDYEELESAVVSLNGQDARRTVFKHKVGALDLQVLCYLLVKDGRGYALICTAKADAYKDHEPIFERTCRTFRIQ